MTNEHKPAASTHPADASKSGAEIDMTTLQLVEALREEAHGLRNTAHLDSDKGGPNHRQLIESAELCEKAAEALAAHDTSRSQPAEVPEGMVLVQAYKVCGEFADDSPGTRRDCAEKQKRGQPCERCPRRAAPQTQQAAPAEQGLSDAEIERLRELADSEGARAVEYLRRARRAEAVISARVSDAALDVLAERQRQIDGENWTPEHDDNEHGNGVLAQAAACYARWYYEAPTLPNWVPPDWPWDDQWWKASDPRRNLVKAAALILAELERLDRATVRAALAKRGGKS